MSSRKAASQAPETLTDRQFQSIFFWAQERAISLGELELRLQVEACLDHFRASGKPKMDWVATAKNWIRGNVQGRPGPIGGAPGAMGAPGRDRRSQRILDGAATVAGKSRGIAPPVARPGPEPDPQQLALGETVSNASTRPRTAGTGPPGQGATCHWCGVEVLLEAYHRLATRGPANRIPGGFQETYACLDCGEQQIERVVKW